MDYTLAEYRSPEYEKMGFDMIKNYLVEIGESNLGVLSFFSFKKFELQIRDFLSFESALLIQVVPDCCGSGSNRIF